METKDKITLENNLICNYNEIIHYHIHDLHAASERLLDGDLGNDPDAILQMRPILEGLIHYFTLRMQLSNSQLRKNGDSASV